MGLGARLRSEMGSGARGYRGNGARHDAAAMAIRSWVGYGASRGDDSDDSGSGGGGVRGSEGYGSAFRQPEWHRRRGAYHTRSGADVDVSRNNTAAPPPPPWGSREGWARGVRGVHAPSLALHAAKRSTSGAYKPHVTSSSAADRQSQPSAASASASASAADGYRLSGSLKSASATLTDAFNDQRGEPRSLAAPWTLNRKLQTLSFEFLNLIPTRSFPNSLNNRKHKPLNPEI